MSAAGQKKGIFGLDRAKAGQRWAVPGAQHAGMDVRNVMPSVRRVRAEPIGVMSLRGADFVVAIPGMRGADSGRHEALITIS